MLCLAGATPSAASAQAGTSSCDATALRLSVVGGAAIAPVQANAGAAACQNAERSLLDLPGGLGGVGSAVPLGATVVEARTDVPDAATAGASARIAGLAVGTDGALGPLLAPVHDALPALLGPVDLSALGALINTLTLGSAGTPVLDVRPLLADIDATLARAIPSRLLGADVLSARAGVQCVNGSAALTGDSQVLGLTVLGQALDLDQTVNRVAYLDSKKLDLGEVVDVEDLLDAIRLPVANKSLRQLLDDLGLPKPVLDTVRGLVGQVVGSLPTISIPPQVLEATVAPNQEQTANGTLTRRALQVRLTVLGREVLAADLAEARVSSGSVRCGTSGGNEPTTPGATRSPSAAPGPSPVAAAALQCTDRRVTLIDVLQQGSRTLVRGAAEQGYAGRTVKVMLLATGKTVGTTKVGADGLFQLKAPLPPARFRSTNAARYIALIGGQRSQALKFHRRMTIQQTTVAGGRVTLSGNVSRPRAKPARAIVIKRRVSCAKYVEVGRAVPNAAGRFKVTVSAPSGAGAAVYRAQTDVPSTARKRSKLFPTFTLPQIVRVA